MICVNVSFVEERNISINITWEEGFDLHMATKFYYEKFQKLFFM